MRKTIDSQESGIQVRVSSEAYGVFLEVSDELDSHVFIANDGYVSLTKDEARTLIKALQEAVGDDV